LRYGRHNHQSSLTEVSLSLEMFHSLTSPSA
jgi:hypothetical protein